MRSILVSAILFGALLAKGQPVRPARFEGQPALILSNENLELTLTLLGASFANLKLREDPTGTNPLWEASRLARELGQRREFRGATGHFVCVDGFGPVSAEEQAAGLPGHGEAHVQSYEVTKSGKEGRVVTVTVEATLPLVQERFSRTVRMVDGEDVVYVDSRLQSLLGFDRPVNWAEHATIGSPFLDSGAAVVDVSGSRSMTRPYTEVKSGASDRRLVSGKEFTWPLAPGLDGKTVDLRETPADPHYLDHAATLVDPALKYGWVTAINTKLRLIIGYVFKRTEYPWVQYWGNYPPSRKMSRGLEFSTQPFDVPRREVIEPHSMFETPVYRWLPAKSEIDTSFMLFYARIPEGMKRVDTIRVDGKRLVIEDRKSGKTMSLAASLAQ